MLVLLRPFRVGQYIDAQGVAGTVRETGLFMTELTTAADGVCLRVPNGKLWAAPSPTTTRTRRDAWISRPPSPSPATCTRDSTRCARCSRKSRACCLSRSRGDGGQPRRRALP
ncbi:mechanosensitive ion channel domain-containing protein [Cupriavidus basilensis]